MVEQALSNSKTQIPRYKSLIFYFEEKFEKNTTLQLLGVTLYQRNRIVEAAQAGSGFEDHQNIRKVDSSVAIVSAHNLNIWKMCF